MNRSLRFGLSVFGLALLLSVVSVSDAKAQGIIQEVEHRMDLNNKSLQSLKADVTMVKYNSQLNIPDTTIGNTSYLLKSAKTNNMRYIRINWTKPVEEQMAVIGDDYQLYRPRLNQVIVGSTKNAQNNGSAGNALAFMSMSKEELKTNYTVVYVGEEEINGGVKTWHLQLTPKKPAKYKTAEIWVDGDGMPRQAQINEQNNDWTRILLANIQKNVTIKVDVFTLTYDKKKVKIVQA